MLLATAPDPSSTDPWPPPCTPLSPPTQGPTKLWCYLTELLLTLAYLVLQEEELWWRRWRWWQGLQPLSNTNTCGWHLLALSMPLGSNRHCQGCLTYHPTVMLSLPVFEPLTLTPFPFFFFGCAHNYFSSLTLFPPACSWSRSTQWPGSPSQGQVKRNQVKCNTLCDVNVYLCCWHIIYNKLWKIMTQQRPQKYMKTSLPVSAVPG